jgi:flagella synthesis protein FlgN
MIAYSQELHELFRQMLDGLGAMSKLLEEESRHLAAREAEALKLASAKKQKLASLLDDLAVRQNAFVRTQNVPSDECDIATFLDRLDPELPETESLRSEWREIVRLTLACKRQNELNGAYIDVLRRHIDCCLNFLHGASSVDATYGPDGARRRGTISRQSFSV